jgi:alpha-galactosidase
MAFSLASPLLGRVHLAGQLHRLSEEQMALVREAMAAYRGIRPRLSSALPFWPLGLPGWHDPVVALGLRDDEGELLTVWRRSGPTEVRVSLPQHAGKPLEIEIAFPTNLRTAVRWDSELGELVLHLPDEPAARTLRLT